MAAGDGETPFNFGSRGRGKQTPKKDLSLSDVSNQGRTLLVNFIHDRMRKDGVGTMLSDNDMVPPETPSGPPVEHIREVGLALRQIGDDLDGDVQLQRLIKEIPPDAPRQTFQNVAKEIFSDGNYSWGRVVALFYFAYKMIIKTFKSVLNKIPLIRGIVEWVVEFMYDNVAAWIISRGGWESISEYFGSTSSQTLTYGAAACGVALVAAFIWWRYYKSQ